MLAGCKRRRAASQRLPGGDPWHYDEVPLTDHQVECWQRTVSHLTAAGLKAIVPAEILEGLR